MPIWSLADERRHSHTNTAAAVQEMPFARMKSDLEKLAGPKYSQITLQELTVHMVGRDFVPPDEPQTALMPSKAVVFSKVHNKSAANREFSMAPVRERGKTEVEIAEWGQSTEDYSAGNILGKAKKAWKATVPATANFEQMWVQQCYSAQDPDRQQHSRLWLSLYLVSQYLQLSSSDLLQLMSKTA